jgi:hypothetical protein
MSAAMMSAPRMSWSRELGFMGVIWGSRVDLIGDGILPPAKETATKTANLFAYLKTCATLVSMQPADEPQAEDETNSETKIRL